MKRTLYFLTGPTAAGKTARALEWATVRGAEVLSCDALQVYRGMDIGTAKATPEERARVPHWGLDLVPARQPYSVAEYAAYAREVVAEVTGRGRDLLVTGGSGFYLKSFFEPVIDAVTVSEALRREVAAQLETEGLDALLAELRRLNPEGLGELDVQNPRRVTRALERCRASGRSLAELRAAFDALPRPFADFEKHIAMIDQPDADLRARIAARTDAMLADGLIDEVRRLDQVGLRDNPSAASAIGYRETLAWLDTGSTNRAALAETIRTHTWQLVRKQRSWFRSQLPPNAVHLSPTDSLPW
ncbi:MAG: tRNA (adenosine(37)-N6)-dimethylallyltransferase MiaA [Verrucomicrobiota bacterium]